MLLLAHPLTPILHWAITSFGDDTFAYLFPDTMDKASGGAKISNKQGDLMDMVTLLGKGFAVEDNAGRMLNTAYDTDTAWGQAESDDDLDIAWGAVIGQWAGQTIITVIIWLAISFWYKSSITDKRPAWPSSVPQEWSLDGKDWRYTTFQCFDHMPTCLYGWCCMPDRLGDNFHTTGVGGFWVFVLAWLCMYIFAQALNLGLLILISVAELEASVGNAGYFCYFIAELFLAAFLAGKRQDLRQKLGDNKGGTFGMDCICYWCCGCCTVIQDGRQIDGATNTRTECCMKLEIIQGSGPAVVMGQPVVGQVVKAES